MFSGTAAVAVPASVDAALSSVRICLWNVPPFAHSSLLRTVAVAVPVASSLFADVLPP